jgi:hypothetical protein
VVDEELHLDSDGKIGLEIAGQSASETSSDEETVRVKVTLVTLLLNGWKGEYKHGYQRRGGNSGICPSPGFLE